MNNPGYTAEPLPWFEFTCLDKPNLSHSAYANSGASSRWLGGFAARKAAGPSTRRLVVRQLQDHGLPV